MIINNLHHLVDDHEQITKTKQKKLERDWEQAEKDEQRKKEIAERDRIQAEDEENSRD